MINPNSLTPKKLVVLAVIGFGLSSFLFYHWETQPTLTSAEVTQFSGTVKKANEIRGNHGYLEIVLLDQPYPFRCFSLYPHAFKQDLQDLKVGTPVSLGVATNEVSSPRLNRKQNQLFFEFITMSMGGTEVLAIDAYNESVESNRRIGTWFCLFMAAGCVWLFCIAYPYWDWSEPLSAILKANKSEPSS